MRLKLTFLLLNILILCVLFISSADADAAIARNVKRSTHYKAPPASSHKSKHSSKHAPPPSPPKKSSKSTHKTHSSKAGAADVSAVAHHSAKHVHHNAKGSGGGGRDDDVADLSETSDGGDNGTEPERYSYVSLILLTSSHRALLGAAAARRHLKQRIRLKKYEEKTGKVSPSLQLRVQLLIVDGGAGESEARTSQEASQLLLDQGQCAGEEIFQTLTELDPSLHTLRAPQRAKILKTAQETLERRVHTATAALAAASRHETELETVEARKRQAPRALLSVSTVRALSADVHYICVHGAGSMANRLNLATAIALGDIVLLLSDDDMFSAERIANQVDYMRVNQLAVSALPFEFVARISFLLATVGVKTKKRDEVHADGTALTLTHRFDVPVFENGTVVDDMAATIERYAAQRRKRTEKHTQINARVSMSLVSEPTNVPYYGSIAFVRREFVKGHLRFGYSETNAELRYSQQHAQSLQHLGGQLWSMAHSRSLPTGVVDSKQVQWAYIRHADKYDDLLDIDAVGLVHLQSVPQRMWPHWFREDEHDLAKALMQTQALKAHFDSSRVGGLADQEEADEWALDINKK